MVLDIYMITIFKRPIICTVIMILNFKINKPVGCFFGVIGIRTATAICVTFITALITHGITASF